MRLAGVIDGVLATMPNSAIEHLMQLNIQSAYFVLCKYFSLRLHVVKPQRPSD